MKTTLCLVRHGETVWNKTFKIQGRIDNPLSEEGVHQAIAVGKYLKQHDPAWDAIVASPLSRTIDTAKIIAEVLEFDGPIETDSAFIERDFGKAEGLTLSKEVYEKMFAGEFEGIEAQDVLQHRIMKAVLAVNQRHFGKRVLISTHSHVIKALFTQIDPLVQFSTPLKNGSLNTVEIEEGVVKPIRFNENTPL